MNICLNCKHVKIIHKSDIWYNWFCCHPGVERVEAIDPVTGAKKFKSTNGLGRQYFGDEKHPNCRDINTDGKCELYQAEVE